MGYFDDLQGETGSLHYKDGGSVQRTFKIPYADLAAAAAAALNPASPLTHPVFTGLIAKSMSYSPIFNPEATGQAYSIYNALVTLDYGPKDEEDSEIGSVSIDIGAETLTLPKEGISTDSGGSTLLDETAPTPFKVLPTKDLQITINDVASLDEATWDDLIGKVNASSWRGHAAGRVLFLGYSPSRNYNWYDNSKKWTVTFKYSVKPIGVTWNHLWIDGAWTVVYPAQYANGDFDDFNLD